MSQDFRSQFFPRTLYIYWKSQRDFIATHKFCFQSFFVWAMYSMLCSALKCQTRVLFWLFLRIRWRAKTFSTLRCNFSSINFNHVGVEYHNRPDIRIIELTFLYKYLYFYKYLFCISIQLSFCISIQISFYISTNVFLYFYEFCKVSSLVSGVRRSPNPDEPTNTANLIW